MVHNVVFKVTRACNLACRYCYVNHGKHQIASRSTVRSVIGASTRLDADTVSFIWHGGEPLLAGLNFFVDAIAAQQTVAVGSGKRFVNSLQTNGTLVTYEFAAFLKEHDFSVGVSLDGPPSLHDSQRMSLDGMGSYQRALEGYRRLKQHDLKLGIVSVIDPVSPPEVESFLDWLEEIEVDSVSLNPLFAKLTSSRGNYPQFLISLKEALDKRRSRIRVRELIFTGTSVKEREEMGIFHACHPGWPCYESISAVDEEGFIYFGCDRFMEDGAGRAGKAFRLGHVDEGGFKKALASEKFSQLALLLEEQKDRCASKCSLFKTCDGGCVADWLFSQDATCERPNALYCQGVRALIDARAQATSVASSEI